LQKSNFEGRNCSSATFFSLEFCNRFSGGQQYCRIAEVQTKLADAPLWCTVVQMHVDKISYYFINKPAGIFFTEPQKNSKKKQLLSAGKFFIQQM
jgi:hypothetical protein